MIDRRLIASLVLFTACTAEPGPGDDSNASLSDAESESGQDTTSGDGDSTGDGDGDSTGDGDGDGDDSNDDDGGDSTATGDGDGDGDSTGDGDGDSTGDGDGDPPDNNDPYDPLSCTGVAWDEANAAAYLGGMNRVVLDDAIMQIRTRECMGQDCGEWDPAEDWTLDYLSYSGGITTHYTPLLMDMNLVLFNDGGTPRLSIQHHTFGAGGYPDDDGMVYGFPPAVIAYPHLRAFNQFKLYPNDYDDLDYQAKDGTLTLGEGCVRWVADPYGTGEPYTSQYAIVFKW